jgi:thiopeptide-type bacteriocin biosynthesis protein
VTGTTPLNCERRPPSELKPGDWLSAHIYYAYDRTPLLTQCVGQLIAKLRADDLISGYFFVRHWLEGSHLRLRIRPDFDRLPEVCELVEAEVRGFLDREPSVYLPERDLSDEQYKQRFLLEFSPEQWTQRYGADGRMPRNEYNTLDYFEYAPEVERYGGPRGLELAEWHAERSSDIVVKLLGTNNVHVRSVLLGLATQLMLAMTCAFMDSPERIARFFADYLKSWEGMFGSEHERYEQAYQEMSTRLRSRVQLVHAAVSGGQPGDLPEPVREWARHSAELREHLARAADGGLLRCPATGQAVRSSTGEDWDNALSHLVRSYVHMTNNRLGVSVASENYLSYVLRRAITDLFPA